MANTRWSGFLLSWLLLSLDGLTRAQTQSTKVVDLGYAQYEGNLNARTGNFEYLGMRFAAAPTGHLRWREPQEPRPTPGIQKADAFPKRCWGAGPGIQPFPSEIPLFSEDCLFLNVITPASGGKDLPVVVWIHGGGYMVNSASGFNTALPFDGNDLVRQAGGGVVAVIIQYRLAVFGFLAGQKVHDGGALNAGLLDQQFALQWVQRHISKFNGDPSKVALWGESAGAGSVLQHIIANNGNTQPPLFRVGISSSPFLPPQYKFNDPIPEQLYSRFVNATGCFGQEDTLECLRQVDVDTLQNANVAIANAAFFGIWVLVPVVDGRLITDRPTELLRKGKRNGDGILAINNAFEGRIFVNQTTADTIQIPDFIANVFPELRAEEIARIVEVYKNIGPPINQANAIMGESIFVCPSYYLLRAFNGKGFKGVFAVPPGNHGDDITYYFPGVNAPPFNNTVFINAFAQSFLNFAMSLDPNAKRDPTNALPHWSRWNEQHQSEMLFNRTEGGDPVLRSIETRESLLRRCDFWKSIAASSAQ